MKKLIVLNHKMHMEYDEIHSYIQKINNIETSNNIIVCPSFLYLESFVNHCNWGVGSQNVYYEAQGNYTGEISTLQLKSLGVEYCLIGHFERKKYFQEDNKLINKKLIACLETNIQPILCFGESGSLEDIKNNLDELLVEIENIDFIIFAYEPLKVSDKETVEQIEYDIEVIYDYLMEKYHSKPNIIYGGGVEKENVNDLFKIEKLNGILIGKISSKIDKIEKIIKSID